MESNREDAKRCIEIAARELAAGDQAKALKFARKAQALYPSPEADSMVAQATSASSSAAGDKASTASSSSATGASAGAKRPATVREHRSRNFVRSILRVARATLHARTMHNARLTAALWAVDAGLRSHRV